MQLAAFLKNAIEKLREEGIGNPQLDARLIACHALKLDRAELLSQSERLLTPEEIALLKPLLARRFAGEPVGRILGKREFWGLDFGLNEATLEPRPDSETLVEAVLDLRRDARRVLDLGTGTGCLLLSLLHDMKDATGLGIDAAPRAVEQAAANAGALGLSDRAAFRIGNWAKGVTETFDVIVSNPPYIPSSDIPDLMREVRDYDPPLALDGGTDGIEAYRVLIPQLAGLLNPHGLAALEVGQGQAQRVADLLEENGFTTVLAHKDLGGIDRCVTGVFGK